MTYKNNDSNPSLDLKSIINSSYYKIIGLIENNS